MNGHPPPSAQEWMDALLADKQDIAPKQRDLLAMLAATLLGNADATEHYSRRAQENGATAQELARMMEIGNAATGKIASASAAAPDSSAWEQP